MNGSAFRSETGAAVVSWPNTPDPVDPDAFEVSPDPNLMVVLAARGETRQRSRIGVWLVGFVVAFLVMCLVAGVTLAQQPPLCPGGYQPKPHAEIIKQLADKYDESQVAVGILASGNLVEIYASAAKGTWTAVTTNPAGMSCVTAAGRNWESLPATPAGSPASYGEH